MLHNMTTVYPKLVEDLASSDFKFYLTGKRAWNTATFASWWEFFVEYSPKTENYLLSLGFTHDPAEIYKDTRIVSTLENIENKVRIQLVNLANLRLIIQDHLITTFPSGFFSEQHAAKNWNAAYDLYLKGQKNFSKTE
jgi:hypothetical protein